MDKPDSSPKNVKKWGFGMAPLSDTMSKRYAAAVSQMNQILSECCGILKINTTDLSELKGMFNRAIRKDQWDWYTVHARLGFPSRPNMQYIVQQLVLLRNAAKQNNEDLYLETIKRLKQTELRNCLSNWDNDENVELSEYGWLYILSTRDAPELLKIGMTTRDVETRVKEINSATGVVFPYSARSVFKVKKPAEAERLIFQVLGEYRIRQDREFFQLPFSIAVSLIESVLFENQMLKRYSGKIVRFFEDKRYGFIKSDTGEEYFFHSSALLRDQIKPKMVNRLVEFDIGYRKNKTCAMNGTEIRLTGLSEKS